MRQIKTIGKIEKGKLNIAKRNDFIKAIQSFNDCSVNIIIEKQYKKRSEQENKYYWGGIIPFFRQGYKDTTGQDIDSETAHNTLKNECNYNELINTKTGEVKKIPKSTAQLTTVEFEEYLQKCREFIYEWFGIDTPLPGENIMLPLNY